MYVIHNSSVDDENGAVLDSYYCPEKSLESDTQHDTHSGCASLLLSAFVLGLPDD